MKATLQRITLLFLLGISGPAALAEDFTRCFEGGTQP